ncbi:MAG TPA: minichromosome maintenance protein MCM [Methanocorpusculum sp.]|nr:minichromosome maintenance protein MCM [Methanocorpusculum sp.]
MMELDIIDRAEEWGSFLKKKYKAALNRLSREYPLTRSITIEYDQLEKFGKTGIVLAEDFLQNPAKTITDIRDAIRAGSLISGRDREGRDITDEIIRRMNIRFIHLPRKVPIRSIRSDQINTFVSVDGIVRRVTEVRPRLMIGVFKCASGHVTRQVQKYGTFTAPAKCGEPGCDLAKPELVPEVSTFVDSQKLRIQETPEGLRGGEQPQSIDIDCIDDLCGTVTPGDRVIINGILKSVQRTEDGKKSTTFDIYIECNSIEVSVKEFEEVDISEEDETTIRNLAQDPQIYAKIAHSIAPTIYGSDAVKEAIALQLFGGIAKEMPDGTRLRGDIHVLLIGDPGIAKSQILRYVVRLAPRGIYTSGKSASSAGLTVAAVKDDLDGGRWTLEAGALVLADKGMVAVDEMDKMQKEDRSSLHEAMEQQSVSIAKAGISATLATRCSLLGAANPKLGRFDDFVNIAEQINMPPSLLSRFDLIFIMKDKPDEKLDHSIAKHILKSHAAGGKLMRNRTYPSSVDEERIAEELKPVTAEIDAVMLRKYLAYAKRTSFPVITPEVDDALVAYYQNLRRTAYGDENKDKPVPVTARQLEALVRLAEASARVRLADVITMADVARVIRIVDRCLQDVAYDPKSGTFDIDRIASSTSKAGRRLDHEIKAVIGEFAELSENRAAKIDDVCRRLEQLGYDKNEIEHMIERMDRAGEVYLPTRATIKVMELKR